MIDADNKRFAVLCVELAGDDGSTRYPYILEFSNDAVARTLLEEDNLVESQRLQLLAAAIGETPRLLHQLEETPPDNHIDRVGIIGRYFLMSEADLDSDTDADEGYEFHSIGEKSMDYLGTIVHAMVSSHLSAAFGHLAARLIKADKPNTVH